MKLRVTFKNLFLFFRSISDLVLVSMRLDLYDSLHRQVWLAYNMVLANMRNVIRCASSIYASLFTDLNRVRPVHVNILLRLCYQVK